MRTMPLVVVRNDGVLSRLAEETRGYARKSIERDEGARYSSTEGEAIEKAKREFASVVGDKRNRWLKFEDGYVVSLTLTVETFSGGYRWHLSLGQWSVSDMSRSSVSDVLVARIVGFFLPGGEELGPEGVFATVRHFVGAYEDVVASSSSSSSSSESRHVGKTLN